MSDDELAAALGYMTTHAEALHMQMQPDETTAEGEETQPEAKDETSGAMPMSKDDTQDKEIQAIREELEALKHDTGTETKEDTATA